MVDIQIDLTKVIKAVVSHTKPSLGSYNEMRGGRTQHPKIEIDGKEVTLKLPYTTGVDVGEKNLSYVIELNNKEYFLQNIYSIAYTRGYENPLIHCCFMFNQYDIRTVLLEANTYKVLRNSFADIIELVREDDRTGKYKEPRKRNYFRKKKG